MKKLIIFLVVIALLPFSVQAASPAEQLAGEMLEAVEQGQTSVDVTVQSTDLNGVLAQMFAQYPVLYYYYNGYNSLRYPTYTTATIDLKNTHIPARQVYVIRDESQLKAAIGLGLARLQETIHFVTYGMELISSNLVADLAHQLKEEAYLAFMGYHGNSISYNTWDYAPVSSYDLSFHYWEGIHPDTLRQWRAATESRALELCGSLFAQDMPDYLKVLKIHDWLIGNSRYNTRDTDAPQSHMAYSALVSGDPVCQGYAEAAMLLFKAAGIPNTYVEGTGTNSQGVTESHAWSCVQVQGNWYMLDITWDDPTTSDGTDVLRYHYYLVTSGELARDHVWSYGDHPNCTATDGSQLLALAQADTGSYRHYSADGLVTVAQAEAMYEAMLSGTEVPEPTEPVQTEPVWTQPETEPERTEPTVFYPDEPERTEPTVFYPDEPERTEPTVFYPEDTEPGYTRPVPPTDEEDEEDEGGLGALLGGLAALGGIGAGIGSLIRKKKKEERRQPKIFDPNDY